MSLAKHDQALLAGFEKRYATSGTLMAGTVDAAAWGMGDVRDCWHELATGTERAPEADASFAPTDAELGRVLRGFDEISADGFDPPLAFESLERDGDALRLIVDGDAVSISWGGWTTLGDVEEQLMGAVSRYAARRQS